MKFAIEPFLAAILLLLPAGRLAAAGDGTDPVVATIGGVDIPASEFRLVMHRQMPSVVDHFQREDGPGYWADTGEPDTPIAMLREKTLGELRRMKTQLVWAAKLGIPAEPSFVKLREQLGRENARRATAAPPRNIIYGPRQYGLEVYYDIQFSESAHRLREKLAKEAEVPEEKIREAYEVRKSEFGNASFEEARSTIEKDLALGIAEDRIREAVAATMVQTNEEILAAVQPRAEP